MAQYSEANIAFIGSHAGVSIGADGSSQMALEDIAQFRSILNGVVLYPSDGVSTLKLLDQMYHHQGISYMRTTRMDTPILYDEHSDFVIGGSRVLHSSDRDILTVVGAGVTLHETLKAYDSMREQGIEIRVIDLYSIQPLDTATLHTSIRETGGILVVEDHGLAGGIGEAVRSALEEVALPVYSLAVTRVPRSGTPEELLAYEEIDAKAIEKKVKDIIHKA
jgi:transketolase